MKRFFFLLSIALVLGSCTKDKAHDNGKARSESDLIGTWASTEVGYTKSQTHITQAFMTISFTEGHGCCARSNNSKFDCLWTLKGDKLELTGDLNKTFIVKELDEHHAYLIQNAGLVGESHVYLTKVDKILPGVWKGIQGSDEYAVTFDASGSVTWSKNGEAAVSYGWTLLFEVDEDMTHVFIGILTSSAADNMFYKVYYLDDNLLLCKDRNNAEFRFVRETPAPWVAFREKDLIGVWTCTRELGLCYSSMYPSVNTDFSMFFSPDHKVAIRYGSSLDNYSWALGGDQLVVEGFNTTISMKELDGRRMAHVADYGGGYLWYNTFVNLTAILPGKWIDVEQSGESNCSCIEFRADGKVVCTDAGSGETETYAWTLGFVSGEAKPRLSVLGPSFVTVSVIEGVISEDIVMLTGPDDNSYKLVRL